MKEHEQSNNVTLTDTQLSRLNTFKNITARVIEAETNLDNGHTIVFGTLANGELAEKFFDLDRNFVSIWNDKLSHMYEDEFMKSDMAKATADTIVRELRNGRDDTIMNPGQLHELWDINEHE